MVADGVVASNRRLPRTIQDVPMPNRSLKPRVMFALVLWASPASAQSPPITPESRAGAATAAEPSAVAPKVGTLVGGRGDPIGHVRVSWRNGRLHVTVTAEGLPEGSYRLGWAFPGRCFPSGEPAADGGTAAPRSGPAAKAPIWIEHGPLIVGTSRTLEADVVDAKISARGWPHTLDGNSGAALIIAPASGPQVAPEPAACSVVF